MTIKDELLEEAEKIKSGDVFNVRLLGKDELQKVLFYIAGDLQKQIKFLDNQIKILSDKNTQNVEKHANQSNFFGRKK